MEELTVDELLDDIIECHDKMDDTSTNCFDRYYEHRKRLLSLLQRGQKAIKLVEKIKRIQKDGDILIAGHTTYYCINKLLKEYEANSIQPDLCPACGEPMMISAELIDNTFGNIVSEKKICTSGKTTGCK
jgi:hypothetical protein